MKTVNHIQQIILDRTDSLLSTVNPSQEAITEALISLHVQSRLTMKIATKETIEKCLSRIIESKYELSELNKEILSSIQVCLKAAQILPERVYLNNTMTKEEFEKSNKFDLNEILTSAQTFCKISLFPFYKNYGFQVLMTLLFDNIYYKLAEFKSFIFETKDLKKNYYNIFSTIIDMFFYQYTIDTSKFVEIAKDKNRLESVLNLTYAEYLSNILRILYSTIDKGITNPGSELQSSVYILFENLEIILFAQRFHTDRILMSHNDTHNCILTALKYSHIIFNVLESYGQKRNEDWSILRQHFDKVTTDICSNFKEKISLNLPARIATLSNDTHADLERIVLNLTSYENFMSVKAFNLRPFNNLSSTVNVSNGFIQEAEFHFVMALQYYIKYYFETEALKTCAQSHTMISSQIWSNSFKQISTMIMNGLSKHPLLVKMYLSKMYNYAQQGIFYNFLNLPEQANEIEFNAQIKSILYNSPLSVSDSKLVEAVKSKLQRQVTCFESNRILVNNLNIFIDQIDKDIRLVKANQELSSEWLISNGQLCVEQLISNLETILMKNIFSIMNNIELNQDQIQQLESTKKHLIDINLNHLSNISDIHSQKLLASYLSLVNLLVIPNLNHNEMKQNYDKALDCISTIRKTTPENVDTNSTKTTILLKLKLIHIQLLDTSCSPALLSSSFLFLTRDLYDYLLQDFINDNAFVDLDTFDLIIYSVICLRLISEHCQDSKLNEINKVITICLKSIESKYKIFYNALKNYNRFSLSLQDQFEKNIQSAIMPLPDLTDNDHFEELTIEDPSNPSFIYVDPEMKKFQLLVNSIHPFALPNYFLQNEDKRISLDPKNTAANIIYYNKAIIEKLLNNNQFKNESGLVLPFSVINSIQKLLKLESDLLSTLEKEIDKQQYNTIKVSLSVIENLIGKTYSTQHNNDINNDFIFNKFFTDNDLILISFYALEAKVMNKNFEKHNKFNPKALQHIENILNSFNHFESKLKRIIYPNEFKKVLFGFYERIKGQLNEIPQTNITGDTFISNKQENSAYSHQKLLGLIVSYLYFSDQKEYQKLLMKKMSTMLTTSFKSVYDTPSREQFRTLEIENILTNYSDFINLFKGYALDISLSRELNIFKNNIEQFTKEIKEFDKSIEMLSKDGDSWMDEPKKQAKKTAKKKPKSLNVSEQNIKDTKIDSPKMEKITQEITAAENLSTEKLAAEKLAAEKLAAEKLAAEKIAAEKRASEKLIAKKLASEKRTAEKLATEKLASEKLTAEKLASEKRTEEKIASEKRDSENRAAEKLAAEKPAGNNVASEKRVVEKQASVKYQVDFDNEFCLPKKKKKKKDSYKLLQDFETNHKKSTTTEPSNIEDRQSFLKDSSVKPLLYSEAIRRTTENPSSSTYRSKLSSSSSLGSDIMSQNVEPTSVTTPAIPAIPTIPAAPTTEEPILSIISSEHISTPPSSVCNNLLISDEPLNSEIFLPEENLINFIETPEEKQMKELSSDVEKGLIAANQLIANHKPFNALQHLQRISSLLSTSNHDSLNKLKLDIDRLTNIATTDLLHSERMKGSYTSYHFVMDKLQEVDSLVQNREYDRAVMILNDCQSHINLDQSVNGLMANRAIRDQHIFIKNQIQQDNMQSELMNQGHMLMNLYNQMYNGTFSNQQPHNSSLNRYHNNNTRPKN